MLHWYGKHLTLNGICKHTDGCPGWIINDVLTTYVFVQHHYFSEWIINSMRPNESYICVSELTIIGSDNGLLPVRHQAVTWTNASLLSIWLVRTICSEIIFIQENAYENVVCRNGGHFFQGRCVNGACFWPTSLLSMHAKCVYFHQSLSHQSLM